MHIESSCSYHIVNIYFPFHVRWRYQGEVDDSAWVMEGLGWKKNCYYCIILSRNWIGSVFCLRDFFSKRMHKSHSYLALGTGRVLVREVQPVLNCQVLNLCTVLLSNQPIAIFLIFNTFAWQVWLGWNAYWIGLRKILCLIC